MLSIDAAKTRIFLHGSTQSSKHGPLAGISLYYNISLETARVKFSTSIWDANGEILTHCTTKEHINWLLIWLETRIAVANTAALDLEQWRSASLGKLGFSQPGARAIHVAGPMKSRRLIQAHRNRNSISRISSVFCSISRTDMCSTFTKPRKPAESQTWEFGRLLPLARTGLRACT